MSSPEWADSLARHDKARMLGRWREFSAEVESRLEAEGVQAADFLLSTLQDVLGRWVAGECSIKETTHLTIASRTLATQLAAYEDLRAVARTALHEAGHAVVASALGVRLVEVRAGPELGLGNPGHVILDLEAEIPRDCLELNVVVGCAGRAALEIGRQAESADFVSSIAMDEEMIHRTVLRCRPLMGEMEAMAFLRYCRVRSAEILRRHWPAVERLADALLQRTTIPGPEAEEIIFTAAPELRPIAATGVTLAA